MSVDVEWADAAYCGVELLAKGSEMPDGQTIDEECGLVLGADSVFVIQGSLTKIKALASAINNLADQAIANPMLLAPVHNDDDHRYNPGFCAKCGGDCEMDDD